MLASLIGGMTVASGLLLLLKPGPVAPFSGVALQSIDAGVEPRSRLFDTAAPAAWQAIVIHDSGTREGSSQTLNDLHKQMGRGGLGYHFVINNGRGQDDGLIEVGFRWQHQVDGQYLEGESEIVQWFNQNAIGVCLIGDTDREQLTEAQLRELAWLVRELQREHGIAKDAVYVEVGSDEEPSQHFPHAWFRQQLANVTP